MACLPLSYLLGRDETKDMTLFLVLTLLVVVGGLLGNFGLIKTNYDPDEPQRSFIRHS